MPDVSDAIVKALEAAGVRYVFGVAGSTTVPLLSAVSRSKKLRFIAALHENASLGMADGYARASGKMGVAILHTTPGLTTALPNLYNAFVDDVPLLVIVGDVNSKSLITEPALALERLDDLARTVTRWSHYAPNSSDAMIAMGRSLNIMYSSEPGPCCIIIPEDVFEEPYDGGVERAAAKKLEVYPDPAKLMEVVGMVRAANWPVLLVGKEVRSREAVAALVRFCEELAVPVLVESPYPSVSGVSFPQDDPSYMGMFRRDSEALEGCDLVVAIGGKMLTERKYIPGEPFGPSTKVVHVHSDPWELGKNFRTDLRLVASPERAALELAELTKQNGETASVRTGRAKRMRALRERSAKQRDRLLRVRADDSVIRPWHLVRALKTVLKDKDYVLVDEGVIASSYLSEMFEFTEVGSLVGRGAGCLGWGLAAAVGVKLAQPGRKVVAYLGDGALLFGPQAIWTAAHYRIPLAVVVCNNRSYTSVGLAFESFGRRTKKGVRAEGCDIVDPEVDLKSLCGSLGATCLVVTETRELPAALRQAISSPKGVHVVDVRIDRNQKGYEISVGGASAWT
jgi:benzoylformate decarboxylase